MGIDALLPHVPLVELGVPAQEDGIQEHPIPLRLVLDLRQKAVVGVILPVRVVVPDVYGDTYL